MTDSSLGLVQALPLIFLQLVVRVPFPIIPSTTAIDTLEKRTLAQTRMICPLCKKCTAVNLSCRFLLSLIRGCVIRSMFILAFRALSSQPGILDWRDEVSLLSGNGNIPNIRSLLSARRNSMRRAGHKKPSRLLRPALVGLVRSESNTVSGQNAF